MTNALRLSLFITLVGLIGSACGDSSKHDSPQSPLRQTCRDLGWSCGVDDNGRSCGTCLPNQACDHGTCIAIEPLSFCAGRACGDDGHGHSCGTCSFPLVCIGGTYCGSQPAEQKTHVLASKASAPLFGSSYGFSFSVPTVASVTYDAISTDGDTFNVGIFQPDHWAVYASGGSGAQVWTPHYKTSIANDRVTLQPGNYVLGFVCTNLIERCAVQFSISATYWDP